MCSNNSNVRVERDGFGMELAAEVAKDVEDSRLDQLARADIPNLRKKRAKNRKQIAICDATPSVTCPAIGTQINEKRIGWSTFTNSLILIWLIDGIDFVLDYQGPTVCMSQHIESAFVTCVVLSMHNGGFRSARGSFMNAPKEPVKEFVAQSVRSRGIQQPGDYKIGRAHV